MANPYHTNYFKEEVQRRRERDAERSRVEKEVEKMEAMNKLIGFSNCSIGLSNTNTVIGNSNCITTTDSNTGHILNNDLHLGSSDGTNLVWGSGSGASPSWMHSGFIDNYPNNLSFKNPFVHPLTEDLQEAIIRVVKKNRIKFKL